MIVIIAIVFLCALVAGLSLVQRFTQRGWRESGLILFSAIYFGIVLLSEGLSVFDRFHRDLVAVFWWMIATSAIAAACGTKSYKELAAIPRQCKEWVAPLPSLERGAAYFMMGVVLLKFVEGVILPPSTQDALAYHIPRFFHWFSHGNLAFYETFYPVQNYIVPGYSLILANIDAICREDFFYPMVQWTSFVTLGITSSLIAQSFGGGRRCQVLSALIVWLMPIAIAQSTSTYCDLLAAATLVAFVHFYLKVLSSACRPGDMVWCGVLGGLAVLSKTQNLLFIPILTVGSACAFFMSHWGSQKKQIVVSTMLIALLAGCMLIPHTIRNYYYYGRVIGCDHNDSLYKYPLSLRSWFYTQTIHASDLCALPIPAVNKSVALIIKRVFPDYYGNPLYHSSNTIPFVKSSGPLASDTTGTFFPIMALVLMGLWMALLRRKMVLIGLYIAVYFCFAAFCAKVAWMPWNNRFFIGILALACTGSTIALSEPSFSRRLSSRLLALAIVFSVPATFYNLGTFVPGFLYQKRDKFEQGSGSRLLRESMKDRTFFSKLMNPPLSVPDRLKRGYHYLLVSREMRYWGAGTMSQLQMQPAYSETMEFLLGAVSAKAPLRVVVLPVDGARPFPLELEYHYWRLARQSCCWGTFDFIRSDASTEYFLGNERPDFLICSKSIIPDQRWGCNDTPTLRYTNNVFAVYQFAKADR